MDARSNRLPAATGLISGCLEGCRCDVCGSTSEVAQITTYIELGDPPTDGIALSWYMCTLCAAVLIERVSGFRARAQVASWYERRDSARNIRLTDR